MSPSLRAIRWRLILTSVFALLLALGSFWLNQWAFAPADDQCTWRVQNRRVMIQEVLPNGAAEEAGLLEGDELLLVHGRRVGYRSLDFVKRFINSQPEGRILVYTVRREGRILRLPVRLVKPFNVTSLIVLLSALVGWVTGLLVVISSPGRKSARHLYYMGLTGLLLSLFFPLGATNLPPPLLLPCFLFAALGAGLAPPLWLHFFLRFPHPFPLRTHRPFLRLLYGSSLAGAFLIMAGLLAHAVAPADAFRGFLRVMDSTPVVVAASVVVPLEVLAGLVLFWTGTLMQRPRKRRALLPMVSLTTVIIADLLIYRLFLLRTAGQSLLFIHGSWIYYTPLPLLPLSFAFAIFRHGLLDVRRAILHWVAYFVALSLVLTVYLGGLSYLFASSLEAIPTGWGGVLVGLSALPIGWLLEQVLLALRRGFRRDVNTARELILSSLRDTRERFSADGIVKELTGALREAYRPHLLLVLRAEGDGFRLPPVPGSSLDPEAAAGRDRPVHFRLPALLLRRAREERELVLGLQSDEADWIREQGPELRDRMDALEAQVLALLMANDVPYAAVVLGGKFAELNYGREDREVLRDAAVAAGMLLETALMHGRLLDQGRIEQELHTARVIQQSLIPTQAPDMPGFQAALRLEPALETGGDLLWMAGRPDGCYAAAVGDVSGKGLPAALYMSQATALLTFAAQQENLAFEGILPALDTSLRGLLGRKDFLTLSLLEWEAGGRFRAVRAGHPPLLLVSGTGPGEAREISSRGRGLGLRPALPGTWEVAEGHLLPGQWLVMYSDGLTEAMNQDGELYGLPRLLSRIQGLWRTGSVQAACEAVFQDVAAFETQNRDDRTLFILARDTP